MKRLRALALAAAFFSLIAVTSRAGAVAGTDYADGVSLYKQKDYRAAVQKFESAMRANQRDASVVYYCALSNQMSNNRARARQLYQYIGTAFAGSNYASLAATALKSMGDVGSAASTDQAASGGTTHSSASSVSVSHEAGPDIVRVPFSRGRGGGIMLEVQVNNRPITFQLDTGAHSCVIGTSVLQELGLERPAAGQKGTVGGVGEQQNIPAWHQRLDLKLGTIYQRDFPVIVQDSYNGDPLLGQDFLRNWELNVDENTRIITFTRRGTRAAPTAQIHGSMDVPFTMEGNHMVVMAEVNSKTYPFYFDTGADSVVFSLADVKKLGLDDAIAGARQGYSMGVGGRTLTYLFTIERLKVGPLLKENFDVAAVESTQMGHPLLGQSFYGEYSYVIDQQNHVIHFRAN